MSAHYDRIANELLDLVHEFGTAEAYNVDDVPLLRRRIRAEARRRHQQIHTWGKIDRFVVLWTDEPSIEAQAYEIVSMEAYLAKALLSDEPVVDRRVRRVDASEPLV